MALPPHAPQWVRPETFAEFRAAEVEASDLPEPAPAAWPGMPERFPLHPVIREAFAEGAVTMPWLNARGELELYLRHDAPGQIQAAAWEFGRVRQTASDECVATLEIRTGQGASESFPFVFCLNTAECRYVAAAFCEQPELRVYAVDVGGSPVAVCRTLRHTESARRYYRNGFRTALGLPEAPPPPEELSLQELLGLGTVYQFAGPEAATWEAIEPGVLEAFRALAADRSSAVRRGPFTLWVARRPVRDEAGRPLDGIWVLVSPVYRERTRGRTQRDPLCSRLRGLPGFVGADEAMPLAEGALPVYRYVEGQVYELPQTDDMLADLREAWASVFEGEEERNPYGM